MDRGSTKSLEGQSQDSQPQYPKEYPTPCSAIKAGEEEGGGDAGSNGICLSKIIFFCEGAHFPGEG